MAVPLFGYSIPRKQDVRSTSWCGGSWWVSLRWISRILKIDVIAEGRERVMVAALRGTDSLFID
jgi:hypothetical protein